MVLSTHRPGWVVLLIAGPSGAGKSTVAERLGRRFGIPWLQVDDLRLALQRSRATLPDPADTAALRFFEETPDVLRLPPERLRDGSIAVGKALSPAIEVVIENHVDQVTPIVIEGDGILPSLLTRPPVRSRATGGRVRAVFVVEPEEDAVYATITARGHDTAGRTEEELRTRSRGYWLYGRWLAGEARRHGLPVLEPRPWATLAERIIAASGVVGTPGRT
jgi:2-phosphoglycerate kinase